MLILDPNQYAKDQAGAAQSISALVEKADGTVLASRLWNEQKLAYPIDGHRKGTYWLVYLEIEGVKVKDLNRNCQLAENIIRHMAIRIDPRLTETLVAMARGEKPIVSRAENMEPEEKSGGPRR